MKTFALLLSLAASAAVAQDNPSTDRVQALRGCLATYAGVSRGKDRRVDVARLVRELVDLRVNTYSWLVHDRDTDWDDLKRFLPLARGHGIKVWVTLVPPSESPPNNKMFSEPFRLDYERWSTEIARLSIAEPNLVAWSVDDFTHNVKFFAPEKLRGIIKGAREINPRLAFVPCCYFSTTAKSKVLNDYRGLLDGILFPYRSESAKIGLTDATQVEAEVVKIRSLPGAEGLPIIVDVYATRHSSLGQSTPAYVRDVMIAAHNCADGVMIYCHQNPDTQPAKHGIIRELYHQWTENPVLSAAQMSTWPELEKVLRSQNDFWGDAALAHPDGPGYEFFAAKLPPLRYVNAAFRHYPIVLGAPASVRKARLVSNGSAINARAQQPYWRDAGFPVTFHVGEDEAPFGAELTRLNGPRYAQGYLPIVENEYHHGGVTYAQEVFAGVEPSFAASAGVLVRMGIKGGGEGKISIRIDHEGPLSFADGLLRDAKGQVLLSADARWHWMPDRKLLQAALTEQAPAHVVIGTTPLPHPVAPLTSAAYEKHRQDCAAAWQAVLDQGMALSVPEPVVNNAWRALILGTHLLRKQNVLCYSHGNLYERQYEAEGGDAARALLLFGHGGEVRHLLPPLLDYQQKGLEFHDAGFKLQLLAHYYWLTHDAACVRELRPHWQKAADIIVQKREKDTGLLPRENYCGDIDQQIYSLNSNANSWRGLRDLAAVLQDMGERDEAECLRAVCSTFRKAILAAAAKSERRDFHPTFIPVALFGEEKPYEVLTASKLGSYWCLMAPYLLGSEIFGLRSPQENAILDTLQTRGGISMGMIRLHQHSGLFANENALDDLYGLRYVLSLLRRDEADRALVSFYGKLAQGMTRDTFICAEGTGLVPLDEHGRSMYLPPNSAANALLLWNLRYLLIQDWDTDEDSAPDELRLLFATPRRWLADGAAIHLERAPTAFGELSLSAQSRLRHGEVVVEIKAPEREPRRMLLRLRLPGSWRVLSARIGEETLIPDERGTLDLSGRKGAFTVRAQVKKQD